MNNKHMKRIFLFFLTLFLINFNSSIVWADDLTINEYKLDNNKKIIYRVPSGTTINKFKSKITPSDKIEILDSNKQKINDNRILHTGDILRKTDDNIEYTISIIGDTTQDGIVNKDDFNLIAKQIIDKNIINNNAALISADYDDNGEVKTNDLTQLMANNGNSNSNELNAYFVIQDKNAATSVEFLSCEKQSDNTCQITIPNLIVKTDYTAIGWNTDKTKEVASVSSGDKITIDKNVTYYSITRSNTMYIATFNVQNANSATASATSATCYRYNGSNSCKVTAPTLTGKNGYNVVGWNKNKDETTADIQSGGIGNITNNVTFYSITSKPITITFDVNEDYDDNTVPKSDSSYNPLLANFKAESLEFYEQTCISYNDKGCYIDDIPGIYINGKFIIGFFENKKGSVTGSNGPNHPHILETKFTKDTTYYARIVDFDIPYGYSTRIDNINISFEEGIKANLVTNYVAFLKKLKSDFPALFKIKGQINFMKSSTFNAFYGIEANGDYVAMGMTLASYYYPSNIGINYLEFTEEQIGDASEETIDNVILAEDIYTVVHEMGHAFDLTYGMYTRNFDNNQINKKSDLNQLYNKYKPLELGNKPMGSYAYSAIHEFWAEAVANTYFDEYTEMYDSYISLFNSSDKDKYEKITDDIKNVVKKYICIANNGFNEGANC